MDWLILCIALFLAGILLLSLARARRAQSGLPEGRLVYVDTSAWRRTERPLFSKAYRITGKPDYLVDDGHEIVPVEVKSGRAPHQPHESHVMQLAAYCLLVEETTNRRPRYGIIKYADVAFEVDYTPELKEALLMTVDEMRDDLTHDAARRNHTDSRRCESCGYAEYCDEKVT